MQTSSEDEKEKEKEVGEEDARSTLHIYDMHNFLEVFSLKLKLREVRRKD